MKLEYSRPRTHGNFGDDLNEWIWDDLAPGLLDSDSSTILLGIGTIFSRWFTDTLPKNSRKVLLGSGGGKAGGAPRLDSSWHVYGVRGPLTAAYSGLGSDKVLTDPAMLLRDVPTFQTTHPRRGIGFMPHIWSLKHWDWKRTAEGNGFEYIDPRDDARETVQRIGHLEGLITEAMHGAIVADAFRTPWAAVQIAPDFESSKWSDWAGSLNMAMTFHSLRDVYAPARRSPWQSSKHALKTVLQSMSIPSGTLVRPRSDRWEIDQVNSRLKWLRQSKPFQLSEQATLEQAIARTRLAIDQLVEDKVNGVFT